mgnify:FL=1
MNEKEKISILDFDSMTEILAVIEKKIQYIERTSASTDSALYDDLCQKRDYYRDILEEMYSENRERRDREKSLNHKHER